MATTFVTLCPLALRPSFGSPDAERFLAFGVVGFLVTSAYPRWRVIATLGVICFAVLLEAGQYLDASRHPRFADALIKSAGAVAGGLAAWGSAYLRGLWRAAPRTAGGL